MRAEGADLGFLVLHGGHGAILVARDLGLRVPDQLSVIGVDKHPLGTVFGLTTIDQFVEEQGTRAALELLSELSVSEKGDSSSPVLTELPVSIVARSSTAAPTTNRNPTFH
nr:substrate-binding domain-containing protein [Arthrobacter sp. 147(2020)]